MLCNDKKLYIYIFNQDSPYIYIYKCFIYIDFKVSNNRVLLGKPTNS